MNYTPGSCRRPPRWTPWFLWLVSLQESCMVSPVLSPSSWMDSMVLVAGLAAVEQMEFTKKVRFASHLLRVSSGSEKKVPKTTTASPGAWPVSLRSTVQAPGSLSLSLALSSHCLNRPPVLNFLGEFHPSIRTSGDSKIVPSFGQSSARPPPLRPPTPGTSPPRVLSDLSAYGARETPKIGRASCRERV